MEFIKDPQIVGVISGNSTSEANIVSRPSHTLIYKVDGESVYFLSGRSLRLSAGTILYIPENESYSFKKTSDGDSLYRLINFHAKIENAEPRLFTLNATENASAIFKQMEKLWRFDSGLAGEYEMFSQFYKLLSILCHSQQTEYTTAKQKESIEPAMEFLQGHLFDSDLKISSLPSMCGMSAPTFRRIFVSRFGTSPRKYVIRQRLLQAKIILESGEYKNISEVAHSVGYDDPLYFSKHFKEFYGVSPSNL